MLLKKVTLWVLLFTFLSSHAFAICEQERSEYDDWNSKCEKLSAASQVSGVAGGIFAIVSFGASMIPCAAASAAAHNACRIRDEKRNNLTRCEAHHAQLASEAQVAAERARAAEQTRQTRIEQINSEFANRSAAIVQHYEQMIQDFIANFEAQGWSMDDPESQELLRTTRATMERERDQRLDQLEVERGEAISHA